MQVAILPDGPLARLDALPICSRSFRTPPLPLVLGLAARARRSDRHISPDPAKRMSTAKYDLFVYQRKRSERNTARSKAVSDCSELLNRCGYQSYGVVLDEDGRMSSMVSKLRTALALAHLYRELPRRAIVAVQYPLPVLNRRLSSFIRAARRKGVRFFCIVHDLRSLRSPSTDAKGAAREACALNDYDHVIVHNPRMRDWLERHGTTVPMSSLDLFDYLVPGSSGPVPARPFSRTIVFAGNLVKSGFVESLGEVASWHFRLHGPGAKTDDQRASNVQWLGELCPEVIVHALDADFGLVWDGPSIEGCHDVLGRYLQYNNPHKLSLYVAAGIPVIVPADAAVAPMVEQYGIGLLVGSLRDLERIDVSQAEYDRMRRNTKVLQQKVLRGAFLSKAIDEVEAGLQEVVSRAADLLAPSDN
jgi:hypothetical protein